MPPSFRLVLACLLTLSAVVVPLSAATPTAITISTAHSQLALTTNGEGRLYELGYGRTRATLPATPRNPAREDEFHPPAGNGFILEPALQAVHADGNTSTDLLYVSHATTAVDDNVSLTRIKLHDPAYPFFVTLVFRAFRAEDVIEQWTEISHDEPSAIVLSRYASSAPVIKANRYF